MLGPQPPSPEGPHPWTGLPSQEPVDCHSSCYTWAPTRFVCEAPGGGLRPSAAQAACGEGSVEAEPGKGPQRRQVCCPIPGPPTRSPSPRTLHLPCPLPGAHTLSCATSYPLSLEHRVGPVTWSPPGALQTIPASPSPPEPPLLPSPLGSTLVTHRRAHTALTPPQPGFPLAIGRAHLHVSLAGLRCQVRPNTRAGVCEATCRCHGHLQSADLE